MSLWQVFVPLKIMPVFMTVNTSTKISMKSCSKSHFPRTFLSFSSVVVVACISFLCGYFVHSFYQSNHQGGNRFEETRTRRFVSDFQSQLLNLLNATNLEENLRWVLLNNVLITPIYCLRMIFIVHDVKKV